LCSTVIFIKRAKAETQKNAVVMQMIMHSQQNTLAE